MVGIIFLLGTVMAALVDEVTSILFMTVIMIKILKCYNVDGKKVLPFIMFLVFTTNIGSSALPIGNPVGVLVAFQAGFTIVDFLRWTLPIAIVASLVTTAIALFYLRRVVSLNKLCPTSEGLEEVKASRDIKIAAGIFIFVIVGLILHSVIEQALGLATDTMLLGFPLLVAGIVLFINKSNAQALIMKVDWWTLLYFMLLFASVGTLAYTGVTSTLATIISHSASGLFGTMLVLGLSICFLTSFMDNVLAVATFAPVVQALVGTGIPLQPIWWIMLIGGTYFGNATIIGSTANIVAAGYLEKKNLGSFSQLGWIKVGVVVSAITFFLAFALLYIQYI